MSLWLTLLGVAWLGFLAGWIGCACFGAWADDRRRGKIDFTPAAARGELLHLDWGDQRPVRCNPAEGTHYHGGGLRCECGERPNVVGPPAAEAAVTETIAPWNRHLRSVE